MTQNPTFRFFISSVIKGLEDERKIVEQIISRDHNAKMSEKFIGNNPSKKMIQDEMAKCNGYIGIFDTKWGEIPTQDNQEKLSITALEYNEAKRLGLIPFILVSRNENKDKELTKFLKEIGPFEDGENWNRYKDNIELTEILSTYKPKLVEQISRKSVKIGAVESFRFESIPPTWKSKWVGRACGNCGYRVKEHDEVINDKCPQCKHYDLDGDVLHYSI